MGGGIFIILSPICYMIKEILYIFAPRIIYKQSNTYLDENIY